MYFCRKVELKDKSVKRHNTLPKELMAKKVGGSVEKNGPVVITFDSAREASSHFCKSESAISTAIRTGWRCADYYWRYL